MRPEDGTQERYFETVPQRERLLLLGHLVRNAHDPLYLRAPEGAGKTVIARRLAQRIGSELRVLDIDLKASPDLIGQVASQLGAPSGDQAALLRAVDGAVAGSGLLLMMDKADELAVQTLPMISHLQDRGARLLFIGRGSLGGAEGEIDCQFIDLPAFDLEQTAAFLRDQAGERADSLDDEAVARLHRMGEGRPGPLLAAWEETMVSAESDDKKAGSPAEASGLGQPWLRWLAGGVAAAVLISALWFQDAINVLFAPAPEGDSPLESVSGADTEVREEPSSVITPLTDQTPTQSADQGEMSGAHQGRASDSSIAPAQSEQTASSSPPRPTIELPEISARSPDTENDAPDDGAADGDIDPLEAVMRDAQAAAQTTQGELDRDVTAANAEVAEAVAMSPAPVSPPASVAGSEPTAVSTATAQDAEPAALEPDPTVSEPDDSVPKPTPELAVVADEDVKAAGADQQKEASSSPAPVVERSSPVDQAKPGAVSVSPVVAAGPVAVPGAQAQQPDDTGEERSGADGPAPVIDRVPPPAASTASASPSPAGEGEGPQAEPDDGARWLAGREPARYTLQIIGARDREAVQAFIQGSGISPPYAVFSRDLGGRPWYSLVAGDYPDRDAAIAAKTRLPASVQRADIWPRTFGSIPKN